MIIADFHPSTLTIIPISIPIFKLLSFFLPPFIFKLMLKIERGRVSLAIFSGGGGQGRIFEDVKTVFIAIIHICVQLTFMSYDLFGSDPP